MSTVLNSFFEGYSKIQIPENQMMIPRKRLKTTKEKKQSERVKLRRREEEKAVEDDQCLKASYEEEGKILEVEKDTDDEMKSESEINVSEAEEGSNSTIIQVSQESKTKSVKISKAKKKKKRDLKRKDDSDYEPEIENSQSAKGKRRCIKKDNFNAQAEAVANHPFASEKEQLEALPYFVKEGYIRDIQHRRPSDPSYDPSTLYIPTGEWKMFTPAMVQYWEIKQHNFDKILFFKLGKFYEIFYSDAIICNRELDLQWMGVKKLHVGFPEKVLDKYLEKLINIGYKVAVIEQVESSKQFEKRISKEEGKRQGKVVKREICSIVTKGTFKDPSQSSFDSRYVLAFKMKGLIFGIAYFDFQTSQIYIGQFQDDEYFSSFRTLLCQIRPVEVIYEREFDNQEVLSMIKNQPIVPVLSPLPSKSCWGVIKTCLKLEEYLGPCLQWPDSLQQLRHYNHEMAISALGLSVSFLEETLLAEEILCTGNFFLHSDQEELRSKYMVLDSQAIEHLELVASGRGGEGSLFSFLDKCKTAFGKRLLKKWLLSPLLEPEKINERLDAIQELMDMEEEVNQFREHAGKLPDVEKNLARVFKYSVKPRVRAVYFENVNLNKLKEYRQLLINLKELNSGLDWIRCFRSKFQSQRMKELLFESDSFAEGIFPCGLEEKLRYFSELILWEKGGQEPAPQKGLDATYDEAAERVEQVKRQLEEVLKGIREKFDNNEKINYSHSKFRYEVEVPVELVEGQKKPSDFEFTSYRIGFQRFHTSQIKCLVQQLEDAEEALEQATYPFIETLFCKFYQQKNAWLALVNVAAEIDCLISLAVVSANQEMVMSRPKFTNESNLTCVTAYVDILDIKQMKHPCAQCSSPRAFIPNDVVLSPRQQVLLVTGPNMGGKSTLLRSVGICVIMAQLGCYVPAAHMRACPVDRVFTRIGASDRILERKSTFYVEMEETKNVLRFATERSLAIVDELGRGTSTFDGYSIAYAVLKYLSETLKCKALFSTHYHQLLHEFQRVRGVHNFHMAFRASSGDDVLFLYKFVRGECPKSFGLNVAKMAGVEEKVLSRAREVSDQFEQRMQLMRKGKQ